MNYDFEYSKDKNAILKETRGVGFEEVEEAIKSGDLLDDVKHPRKARYPVQRMLVVKIGGYAYLVPYVVDKKRKKLFLKTLYPNRKATKKYLGK